MLSRNPIVSRLAAGIGAIALLHCGGASDSEATSRVASAIVNGTTVSDPASPVLYLTSPEGACTATLIAPNLVVTARHCVAQTSDGTFSCTPQGDLTSLASGGGQIGKDDDPGQIALFTNAQVVSGTAFSTPPVAVGAQVISTGNLTVCRDDLAFVVLNQAIPGITPTAIRLLGPTSVGEAASAWGYGLTSTLNDPLALRVRRNADIVGVGPDTPTSTPQPAPVRAIRLGPDDITCNGDSGGPILAESTGAMIAIASLGNEASFTTPTCQNNGSPDTTGPRLAEYRGLTLEAFQAAGATPTLEAGEELPDAAPPPEASIGPDGTTPEGTTSENLGPTATGGSCSVGFAPGERASSLGTLMMTIALAASAVGRRRR